MTEITDEIGSRDSDDINPLVTAEYCMTDKGKAALRRGFVGGVPGEKRLPIDSVRARAKPAVKRKAKRR